MNLTELRPENIRELWRGMGQQVTQATHLEHSAQRFVEGLRTAFPGDVALARVFVTVPYDRLPEWNREAVDALAENFDVASQLDVDTPVLSLLGTSGVEDDWNSRFRSRGHVGIPLISSSFVDGIPMISGLLTSLGVPLRWVDERTASIVEETLGRSAGLFRVEDATAGVDVRGRYVIPARDFVEQYRIRTVFGVGGAFFGGVLMAAIVFCRVRVSTESACLFLPLANLFKAATTRLATSQKVFDTDTGRGEC